MICVTNNVFAVTNYNQEDITAQNYDYSIKLDSIEWSNFTDHTQKINACKIDDQILDKMSTDKVIDMVLEYPLLIDIFAYNSLQTGFEVVSTYCDPLNELLDRRDAGEYLLINYKNQNIDNVFSSNIISFKAENSNFLKLCVTEILLAQPEIYNDLTNSEKKQLIDEVNQKYQEKSKDERFGILKKMFYQVEKEASDDLEGSLLSGISVLAITTQITYSYSLLPVSTPKGTYIYPYIANNDYTSAEKTEINNQYINAYPNATYLSTSTAKYNCHSYAWHLQSTSNGLWIDYPTSYWSDGSYTYVGSSPTANGQKVYYDRSGTEHSGVVTNYSTKQITSKWGQGPLMSHKEKDCPYYVAGWSVLPVIKYYKG